MRPALIVVNGAPSVGKDTFVNLCIADLREVGLNAISVSSVDRVKEAARLLGWDGQKNQQGRDFLSHLKDISTAEYDGPMRYMDERITLAVVAGRSAVFLMLREPAEIRRFVQRYPKATTIQVVGEPRGEAAATNHADLGVNEYPYDIQVQNCSTLDHLRSVARNTLKATVVGYE